MVIVPNSEIILIKSPLKFDNYNQLTFNSKNEQFNYFNSLPKLVYENCTYNRKDGVIRYETDEDLTFEDLLTYNYCMYKNTSYSDKWFYAFITDIKYINDGMSEITIDTDVFQSWQFDIQYKNSFIEREHVADDRVGLHTIPENLETGEYIVNNINKNKSLTSTGILVASTVELTSPYAKVGGSCIGGVYQGFELFAFSNTVSGRIALSQTLRQMNLDQKLDAIVGIYLANTMFYNTATIAEGSPVEDIESPLGFTWGYGHPDDTPITKLTTLDNYTPKNNKLKTYPFMYLLLDNGNGSNAIYRYEEFKDPITPNRCEFDIVGAPVIGGSYYATPLNYGGNITDNLKNRLQGGKLPACGFQNDTWINWITQNAVNSAVGMFEDVAGIGMGIGSGSAMGAISASVSGLAGIVKNVHSLNQASKVPPQATGNVNMGDVNFATKNTTFTAYAMSIKSEYAKIIDDFFQIYGYKVNSLNIPNIKKRLNWDYMKCVDVNLEGEIPEKDMEKIRNLFNNGCTFWHNPNTYLDYSQNNPIL